MSLPNWKVLGIKGLELSNSKVKLMEYYQNHQNQENTSNSMRPSNTAVISSDLLEGEELMQPEIIPGTVQLVEIDKHSDKHHQNKDILLVPQPSEHPDDPLNWTFTRKAFCMFWMIIATIIVGSSESIFGVCTDSFVANNVSETALTRGNGCCFLFLAWSNLILQPLALSYGRRPVLIIALIGVGACMVWLGYASSDGSYYGARIVHGVFGAPYESLIEIVVEDLFFEHERAFWMGFYVFALYFGSVAGPLASAFVLTNMSFRWVFYFHAIFCGAMAIIMLLLAEETGYNRSTSVLQGLKTTLPDIDAENERKQNKDTSNTGSAAANLCGEAASMINEYEAVGRMTYGERMCLIRKLRPFPSANDFLRPFLVLTYFPQIAWAGAIVATAIISFQIMLGTVSMVFGAAPYNFGIQSIGLTYIGPIIGTCLGCIYSGPISDWFCVQLARRRGGMHEAENRLYLGLINILFQPFGFFLYGIGAAHSLHWSGPIFGMGVVEFTMMVSSNIPYVYALDACRNLGSDAVVAIILVRNTVSFAFAFVITPWVENQGLQNTFLVVGFVLGLAFWITAIPVIKYGKKLRRITARKYYQWSKELTEKAISSM